MDGAAQKAPDIPLDSDLLGDARQTPLTGAERLARRIAERSSTSDASDISTDFLPPEDMGPVADSGHRRAAPPTARLTPGSEKAAASAPAPEVGPRAAARAKTSRKARPGYVWRSCTAGRSPVPGGHFIIALAMFERILKTQPLGGRARYGAALCAVQTGETRKARRLLNLADRSPGSRRDSVGDRRRARTPFRSPAIRHIQAQSVRTSRPPRDI